MRHVTLMDEEWDGSTTWQLLGPDGMPIEAFAAFAKTSLRKGPLNTRISYARNLAKFFDYMFEALAVRLRENPGQLVTRDFLTEALEAYDDYLVLGSASGKPLAKQVSASMPSRPLNPRTSTLMHAPVRRFLKLSEHLRQEMEELSRHGLRQDIVDECPLLPDLGTSIEASPFQQRQMEANSMIAGVVAGGPKLLHTVPLPTNPDDAPFDFSRAFPFDSIADFIEECPAYRDKALYSLLAACGGRMHEGTQILFDDIDVGKREILLRNPKDRWNCPSYRYLSAMERERLAWKGRTTETTLLIEPFASMFFENLQLYLHREYIPHGLHRFVFQFRKSGMEGRPYFLSTHRSRLDLFRAAAFRVGIADLVSGPHSLRHAYGIFTLNYLPRPNGDYGLPLAWVQQLMGHAEIKSTKKYARHDKELMKLEFEYANAMIYKGAIPKSVVELKLEAMNAQIEKLKLHLKGSR